MSTSSSSEDFIYHERQEAALCGQHALNNLVQASVFTPGMLSDIAHQLDQMELTFMSQNNEGGVFSKDYIRRIQEGSGNVDASGNFSIQVLRAALKHVYNLDLPSICQEDLESSKRDILAYPGFICNRSEHWFAIRKIGPKFWNLNSLLERPEPISHFRLATELESYRANGYSVFVVTQSLPAADQQTGLPKHWWRRSELEGKGTGRSTASAPVSDWHSLGSGRRLDGKSHASGHDQALMTEDQMLEDALEASILPDIPDEPSADASNAATIQIRFADGKRQIRRFDKDHPVFVVYAYCKRELGGGIIDLRFGFPPKDLHEYKEKTIGEANLHGQTIQARTL